MYTEPDQHKRVEYKDCPYYIAHLDEPEEPVPTPTFQIAPAKIEAIKVEG